MRSEKFFYQRFLGKMQYSLLLIIVNGDTKEVTDRAKIADCEVAVQIGDKVHVQLLRIGHSSSIIDMDR